MKTVEGGNILFLGLSWEERCFLGLKEDFVKFNQTSKVIVLFNARSSSEDNANRIKIEDFLTKRKVEFSFEELSYDDPIISWKRIEAVVEENKLSVKKPVVDITTLPRGAILDTVFFYQTICNKNFLPVPQA